MPVEQAGELGWPARSALVIERIADDPQVSGDHDQSNPRVELPIGSPVFIFTCTARSSHSSIMPKSLVAVTQWNAGVFNAPILNQLTLLLGKVSAVVVALVGDDAGSTHACRKDFDRVTGGKPCFDAVHHYGYWLA